MNRKFQSDLAIYVGEFLEEVLHKLGISQEDLSKIISLDIIEIKQIINGDMHITESIAEELQNITNVPIHIWLGLENEYLAIKLSSFQLKH